MSEKKALPNKAAPVYTPKNRFGAMPCPFCGTDDDEEMDMRARTTIDDDDTPCFQVACSCGSTGPFGDSEESAIKAWNLRAFTTMADIIGILNAVRDGKIKA
jgi:Lar family restriction alleviation protein